MNLSTSVSPLLTPWWSFLLSFSLVVVPRARRPEEGKEGTEGRHKHPLTRKEDNKRLDTRRLIIKRFVSSTF